MFKKILIANRGEIAVRVIRACKEMGIATVAVFSKADATALHVLLADESVCIGPPSSQDSYLNRRNILQAALMSGAQAIHPCYGYLAENASFAEECIACNIKFIGPSAQAIDQMGDKAQARELAKRAGVPIIPGSDIVNNEREAAKIAAGIGYPVMIKAVAGGGGKGIQLVNDPGDLKSALDSAQAAALSAFGNGDVYIEKFIVEPRHIEIQLLADEHGHAVHLGERECSVQTRRHQKMLEEAPGIGIAPKIRQEMGDVALKLAKEAKYTSSGTVEFLFDGKRFYFLEMNTRLQVEHPVTESVVGIDIVQEQIRIAAGERLKLDQRNIQPSGHAIECRITAEDPARDFQPTSGMVERLILPGGPGVRVDTHIYAGYNVPPYYDSLLAKIIVWGQDRKQAITRMRRALGETDIRGIATNLPFHRNLIDHPQFIMGDVSTSFLEKVVGT